jgi:hypothetical protein
MQLLAQFRKLTYICINKETKTQNTQKMTTDSTLNNLIKTAKAISVIVDAMDFEDPNYEKTAEKEQKAFNDLHAYCLNLLPKSVRKQVENSSLYRAKILDRFVFNA